MPLPGLQNFQKKFFSRLRHFVADSTFDSRSFCSSLCFHCLYFISSAFRLVFVLRWSETVVLSSVGLVGRRVFEETSNWYRICVPLRNTLFITGSTGVCPTATSYLPTNLERSIVMVSVCPLVLQNRNNAPWVRVWSFLGRCMGSLEFGRFPVGLRRYTKGSMYDPGPQSRSGLHRLNTPEGSARALLQKVQTTRILGIFRPWDFKTCARLRRLRRKSLELRGLSQRLN